MSLSGGGLLPTTSEPFQSFLQDLDDAPSEKEEALLARNAFVDERVTQVRSNDYLAAGAAVGHGDLNGWIDAHEGYLRSHVALPFRRGSSSSPTPDTFLAPENAVALAKDVDLVRLIPFPTARHVSLGYAEFENAVRRVAGKSDPDPVDVRVVESGLHQWQNKLFDMRPRWCSLWMEMRDLFGADASNDRPDWADLMRDRCGLFHLDPVPAGPIKVLLLRYRVAEFRMVTGGRSRASVAVPSILDGDLFPPFCPMPEQSSHGMAVNLIYESDVPYREYVHAAFRIRSQHLYRVGDIRRNVTDLITARQGHLHEVRRLTSRPDYGLGTDP